MKFEHIPQNDSTPETSEKKKPGIIESLKAKATKAVQLGGLMGVLASTEVVEAQDIRGGGSIGEVFDTSRRK